MSSISSGVDLSVKYQRLAVEYVKVRNQVAVLKSALLEEQSKRADSEKEIALSETRLFKLEAERDSLLFRNEQLLKRVEGLQESMDAQQATFGMAKGKKKHKEANLRLVAESSRMHRQALGAPSSSDPTSVLEGELERKISENSELHSKLFDVERLFDETVTAYTRRIDELEKENEALKTLNSLQRNELGICESQNDATAQTLRTDESANGGKGTSSALLPSIDSTDGISDCSNDFTSECANSQTPLDQQTRGDGKTSDFTDSSNFGHKSNGHAGDVALPENYSAGKMSTLVNSLQHATGRATYYKQECEELLRKGICDRQRIETLERNVRELSSKCHALDDALETTQSNYEAQLRHLHEHLAQNEEKMTDRSERTLQFNGNGRDKANGGERAKRGEKGRSNWFSPSSSK